MVEKLKHFARHVWHKVSLSGLVGALVIFIVFSLVFGSVQAIQQNFQRQIEVDTLAQQVALMELETETIRFENQYFQTDEYLELQARKLLGKAAPGEKVIILPKTTAQAPPVAGSTAQSADVPLKDRSNLEQWLYFLFSDKRINQER